ncbi:hypothetical protein UA08_08671 [Talaromyces atroroseus]|uniref:ABC transporter domain-containing protein n=1 Tax=Talaromyces atroroseus TaxID=1441469 RepID=A0A225AB74_TALAT|nr:hypothetical protein UA08_08671 [Talaromyces atroroseus]OKL56003.1 hypothetical protein UA08_08671 [Talaromyces atroroseus]
MSQRQQSSVYTQGEASGLADVLAGHIIILYRGRVVCQGPSTGLKDQYGDGYRVISITNSDTNQCSTWKLGNSTEATRKVLDLEGANKVCDVVYPTLELAILRVTSDSMEAQRFSGDGIIGDEAVQTMLDDQPEDELHNLSDLDLEVGRAVGMLRQVWLVFRKRYMLLRSGWFVYLVNLAIPIVVAAALFKYIRHWDTLTTCDMQRNYLYSGSPLGDIQDFESTGGDKIAVLGPNNCFSGAVQDQLLVDSVSSFLSQYDSTGSQSPAQLIPGSVVKVGEEDGILKAIEDAQGLIGFGLRSPEPGINTFFHVASPYATGIGLQAFDYVTNRMSNMTASAGLTRKVSSSVQVLNHVPIKHEWRTLPLQMLVVLVFVAAASTASHVRALQYSNRVSPLALWVAYLLFDIQFILIEAWVVWGLLFSGPNGNRISSRFYATHSIYVNGISVVDQARKARMDIGVCPQEDAVDNLTVQQTLTFYASVKGLKNVQSNVGQVLTALNISRFKYQAHKALSGGTKRKLAVAIALLGNPQLLLLDEPSTGQDAGAKRILWQALRRVGSGRAILLTTHSMEEAEALASKVAIVSTRILAAGSLSSLQEMYGDLYEIRALRLDTVNKYVAETEVRSVLGQWGIEVVDYWDANGLVQFDITLDRTALGRIMVGMECLVGNHGIISTVSEMGSSSQSYGTVLKAYNLIGPTMEEVFMNVMILPVEKLQE